jgi:hypothetical protein
MASDFARYDRKGSAPLAAYATLAGVYNLLLAGLVRRATRHRGKASPPLPGLREIALLGTASHKLSRVITKDAVTAPLRAPFAEYREDLGYGEVNDVPRGHGPRRVLGELLTCNYCMDMWVALGFAYGLREFPRPTRFLLAFFSSVALADFLHVLYESQRTRENVLTLAEERLEKKSA